jgi:glycolate oxidase FAD binding subunit
LGVLTEVSFKVLPAAEAQATLSLPNLDAAAAVKAMAAALGSPFEVSGAAWDGGTHLRIEGLEGSVAYRTDQLRTRLASWGAAEVITGDDSARLWEALRDAKGIAGDGDIWRIHCRPSQAPDVVDAVSAQAMQLDWGGGLIWLRVPKGTDLRAALPPLDGHATQVNGASDRPPQSTALAVIEAGLQAKFDPSGVLSPLSGRA